MIGKVEVPNKFMPFLRKKDLSTSLVERGYASFYTGGGAKYDGKQNELEKKIRRAQEKKRGIWSNRVDNYVDPAAYKRETRAR